MGLCLFVCQQKSAVPRQGLGDTDLQVKPLPPAADRFDGIRVRHIQRARMWWVNGHAACNGSFAPSRIVSRPDFGTQSSDSGKWPVIASSDAWMIGYCGALNSY